MILKSETYKFHRLDLTRQAGFIVTIYDEDGLRLAAARLSEIKTVRPSSKITLSGVASARNVSSKSNAF